MYFTLSKNAYLPQSPVNHSPPEPYNLGWRIRQRIDILPPERTLLHQIGLAYELSKLSLDLALVQFRLAFQSLIFGMEFCG